MIVTIFTSLIMIILLNLKNVSRRILVGVFSLPFGGEKVRPVNHGVPIGKSDNILMRKREYDV